MKSKMDSMDGKINMMATSDLELENRVLRARLSTLGILSALENVVYPNEHVQFIEQKLDSKPDFEFNATRDTTLAHTNNLFNKVLHIFNAEFYGIRSAAGSLPGGKLAVSAEKTLLPQSLSEIVEQITKFGFNKFILHGYSKTMDDVARYIHKVLEGSIFSVWHGNFAQLVYSGERETFERWQKLLDDGIVEKAHILKQGANDFLKCGFEPLLLNLPPKWKGRRIIPAFSNPSAVTAFLPSWLDVRKNWYANMLAAERSDIVYKLFHYADARPVFGRSNKATQIKFDPITHMDVMSSVDLVLNATLIDCHPMVDLEALAGRTPAITSRLFLGELDLHPYAHLTTVQNALDTKEIAERIKYISSVGAGEITEMMDDYSKNLIELSFSRYGEFLYA